MNTARDKKPEKDRERRQIIRQACHLLMRKHTLEHTSHRAARALMLGPGA